MARVQLIIPDEDRDQFVHQARKEGLTFSAWLRIAARERLEAQQRVERFESSEDVMRFFQKCAEREGPGVEPDWEDHLHTLRQSITNGLPNV